MPIMLKLLFSTVVAVIVAVTEISCEAVVVLENREVTLTCDISPTAPRTSAVFWYSNSLLEYLTTNDDLIPELRDADLSLYQRISVAGSVRRGKYNLRIVDVRAEDAGDYVCGYYRSGNEWITVKTVTVDVLTPPGREYPACSAMSSGDTLLLPGMLVNLSCISYGGSPRAQLTWYREGVPLESTVTHGGLWVYHQRFIQEDDSGVEFTCEATSTALPEPKSCSIVPYRKAPLLYVEHIRGGLVGLGDSATFTCTTQKLLTPTGRNDKAQYQWYFNGEPAEENRSGIVVEDGKSLILRNVTAMDDKAVVSCEKVDEFTTRSSASMTILVVSPTYPVLIHDEKDLTPSQNPASFVSTPVPAVYVSQVGFVTCIFGAFLFGMFFMLFLILILRLYCNYTRKRGRLDFSTEHEIAVGWQKAHKKSSCDDARQESITVTDRPATARNSPVRTFKKPNGVVANGNLATSECAECLRSGNTEGNVATNMESPCPVASSDRSAARLSQQSRKAVSNDPLPGPTPRKKPPPLSLFNENSRPLLSSPSPNSGASRRLPSVDRDHTASMPDLASRQFGDPAPSCSDHDYVNLHAPSSSREESGGSTPSSYVNCEFVSPIPPITPVKKQFPKSALDANHKSVSYAELDLPSVRERPTTPISPISPGSGKARAGSVSVERTKYAQIAYVFKDRRQQSLPSVKLVGLSEGFGDKV
ncbi:uncharacterized protein LOC110982937 [Acanthaster planci]|uniref:Uncharacterized protein LOC110982937 n=1 Tax=Acanthaster planci TaxID=133434 RepID=A0A8B7YXM7_ACAPL|nr:uncharacterized protein LOC110982937 [Acanthaster planci]